MPGYSNCDRQDTSNVHIQRSLSKRETCIAHPACECDLLLTVNGEASHGTAPLVWDICWFTTRRHDGAMAGPHRRYSYPGRGLGVIFLTETPQRFEIGVSNVLGLGVPILCIYVGGVTASGTSYYGTMMRKYP